MKTQFIHAMEQQKKSNGKAYAEKTVSEYAGALFWDTLRRDSNKERLWFFCCENLGINKAFCYGRLTKTQLENVLDFMRQNETAQRHDESVGNRTTSNAIKMLIRCWPLTR